MSVRPQTPMSDTAVALIAEYTSTPTLPSPPQSPLTLLSSSLALIPSSPLPVPSLPLPLPLPTVDSPTYAEAPLCYKATRIRLRSASPLPLPSLPLPSPPLPPPSSPLLLPYIDRRVDIPEAEDLAKATEEVPPTTMAELSQRVMDLVTTVRRYHLNTTRLVKSKARVSREAWAQSMGYSKVVHDELQLIAALGRIGTLKAREPAHTDNLEDADSCKEEPEPPLPLPLPPPPMTDAAIRALIARGVADALAEQGIQRNTSLNGDGSQDSRSGIARPVRPTFDNQVKFATCTLNGVPLTWWNSHVKTVGHDAAYGMPLKILMKMMTSKYCPRNEINKLEIEIWNLKSDVVEKYVSGLPYMIQGNVMSTKPKTMEEAIEMTNNMMDQKLRTLVERQIENKRKQDDNSRNNQNQQQPNKRQNTVRAYTAGPSEKREYSGSILKCCKCNYYHNGSYAPKCHKCNKVGYLAYDCRSSGNANTGYNQRATRANQKGNGCYECGAQGHFKRECLKLKKNRGNQGGNGNAPAKVYVVGNAGINPDSNVVTSTFLLNNRYAYILFDTGADRSFMSTAFNSVIDITPITLDHYYDVELANEKIIRINTIIRGCTLNLLNHSFNIDLMPVELGSFDFIIGMDWLAKYHAIIVCAEKIVRILGEMKH
ncbi:putative reverse transcriptase domain-containing protein [Tanacetum coccineum]|uniref:Reverse transcriptase domain-containing protein n=1 Tax=Tanacetum coccineum TaxID=301880 RepID=A0ABQ4X809_9ASTR